MPFGLSGVSSSFQAFINDVLRPYLDIFCLAYLDDVIVSSHSLAKHKKHVHAVITALRDTGLQLDIDGGCCTLIVLRGANYSI
jgi:hypothetical protein